jgi:hypothetical protein
MKYLLLTLLVCSLVVPAFAKETELPLATGSGFANGSTVTVTVSPSGNAILDDLGNVMAEDSWSFEVIPAGVESASLGGIKATSK